MNIENNKIFRIDLELLERLTNLKFTKAEIAKSTDRFFSYKKLETFNILDTHFKIKKEQTKILKIFVNHFNGNFDYTNIIVLSLLEQRNFVLIVSEENEADYTLHIRNEKIYITQPYQVFKPLFEPFELEAPNVLDNIKNTLIHISNWHYIQNLKGSLNIEKEPFKIEIFGLLKSGEEIKVPNKNDEVILEYEKFKNQFRGQFSMYLKNNSKNDLYVTPLYLSYDFSCSKLLKNSYIKIPSNDRVRITNNGKERINFHFNRIVKEYNWELEEETVKFIISLHEPSDNFKELKALPDPYSSENIHFSKQIYLDDTIEQISDFSDCSSQDLKLKFPNPAFNQITKEKLKKVLAFDKMADFSLGIYYDVAKDRLLRPIYKLKPEIKIIDDDQQ